MLRGLEAQGIAAEGREVAHLIVSRADRCQVRQTAKQLRALPRTCWLAVVDGTQQRKSLIEDVSCDFRTMTASTNDDCRFSLHACVATMWP